MCAALLSVSDGMALNPSKVHSSIVVLASGKIDVSLDAAELGQIIRDPQIETISPANLATITSLRDQIGVEIQRNRLQIRDHSDSLPCRDGFTRIAAELVNLVRQADTTTLTAYGFNYDVAFGLGKHDKAARTIAQRFMNTEAIERLSGIHVAGGAVRFFYHRDHRRCYLYLEPRRNDLEASEFYAHVNVHFDLEKEDVLVAEEALDKAFRHEYADFVNVIESLFG